MDYLHGKLPFIILTNYTALFIPDDPDQKITVYRFWIGHNITIYRTIRPFKYYKRSNECYNIKHSKNRN